MLNFYPFPHAVLSSKDAWFFYYTLFLLGNLILWIFAGYAITFRLSLFFIMLIFCTNLMNDDFGQFYVSFERIYIKH